MRRAPDHFERPPLRGDHFCRWSAIFQIQGTDATLSQTHTNLKGLACHVTGGSTLAVLHSTSLHSLETWANYRPWFMLQGNDVTGMSYNRPPNCALAFTPSSGLCAPSGYSVERRQVSQLDVLEEHTAQLNTTRLMPLRATGGVVVKRLPQCSASLLPLPGLWTATL